MAAARPAGGGGIIPARAGFTWGDTLGEAWIEDHPRSRGVYWSLVAPAPSLRGSSPLARGLRADDMAEFLMEGIIPARAGFTWWRCWRRPRRADHPRSRGVYAMEKGEITAEEGSSPLARGLPLLHELRLREVGIIPARAGFTRLVPGVRAASADHPRSRGVYMSLKNPLPGSEGSSPLARGLPLSFAGKSTDDRIIPARAGFTARSTPPPRAGRDHPRSRGVY